MGIKELKKDDVLHKAGDRVQEVEIVLKGSISIHNADGAMILKTGSIIGAAEIPGDTYSFDYTADSDATVYAYDFSIADDVIKVIKLNQKIAPVLASSSVRSAVDCYSWYEKIRTECENLYKGVKRDLEDYKSLMVDLSREPEDYPEIENLMEPREADGL